MSDKKDIFSALQRTELSSGSVDFRGLLSKLAERVLEKTRVDADTFADVNLKKYWNWLAKEIDDHQLRGLTPFFSVSSGGIYAISSACEQLKASVDLVHRKRGQLGLSRPAILRQIDLMTDREYEALACVACTAIGSAKVQLTPPGNEGGIDFLATLSLKTSTHVLSAVGAELRIVGQCKKYTTPVAVDKLDQFVTTMQNVRHRDDRVRRHIPPWFADSRGPILGWVIAHSGFQTGAADVAKNHGILVSDTLDIAELLGMSEHIDPTASASDRAFRILSDCRKLI